MTNDKRFVVRHGIITDNVQFNTGSSETPLKGEILWNEENGTIDIGLTDTGVVLQSGQEVVYRVTNNTGNLITSGTLVMAVGTLGQSGRILIAPAIADGTVPSKYIMGIVTDDIGNNSDGYVTHFGKIRNIDTSAWSDGDILYADPDVVGGLTDVIPEAPNSKTTVAIVISSHPTTGTLFVRPTYGSNLSNDELVELDNLQDGDIIVYNDATERFENVSQNTTNVLYVSKSGDDSNSGKSLSSSFLSIEAALAEATSGTTIFVKSGDYVIDNNPVTIPANVSIIGDNLRSVTIRPSNTSNDIFYVNNGCYITGVTFRDHVNGAAAVAFNPNGSAGMIFASPYIQNCSSITTTGVGMRVDGSHADGLKSMLADSFTQINANGKGVHILNQGYAQLVSIFTVSCDIGILAENGGQCSLLNSNCSFGNIGIKSTGLSPVLYSGTTGANSPRFSKTVTVGNLTTRPKYGDAIKFGSFNTYYTVAFATELSNGISLVTLEDSLEGDLSSNDTVEFFQRSLITASSITFEYVGTGTSMFDTPRSGAFPVQENEIVEDSNKAGKINFTSTDHKGDFRIGNDLVINRESGTIQGITFDRSLFAVLTPYILALD
jgi:hypothetical protein